MLMSLQPRTRPSQAQHNELDGTTLRVHPDTNTADRPRLNGRARSDVTNACSSPEPDVRGVLAGGETIEEYDDGDQPNPRVPHKSIPPSQTDYLLARDKK